MSALIALNKRILFQVEKLMSMDPALNLSATTFFRKVLSIEKRPPIEEVVSCPGVVQRLVQYLGADHDPRLQFEAAWAVTNVCLLLSTPFLVSCLLLPNCSPHLTSHSLCFAMWSGCHQQIQVDG
jgi:hypothetical protein